MNSENKEFAINLGALKSRKKPANDAAIKKIDQVAENEGFVSREPKRRGGRAPSPRTEQIHTKVLPGIGKKIAQEAARRGVTQGVIIEEAWALYMQENDL